MKVRIATLAWNQRNKIVAKVVFPLPLGPVKVSQNGRVRGFPQEYVPIASAKRAAAVRAS